MKKLIPSKIVKDLYEYFITNWDKYRANIYNPDTIKITAADVRYVLREKFPEEYEHKARKAKTVILPWLFTLLKREFELNGFKVEKKVMKKARGFKRPILYVHKQ